MTRGLACCIAPLALLTIGCGVDRHEAELRVTFGNIKRLIEVLEEAKTADDAKKIKETLSSIAKDLRKNLENLEQLPNPQVHKEEWLGKVFEKDLEMIPKARKLMLKMPTDVKSELSSVMRDLPWFKVFSKIGQMTD